MTINDFLLARIAEDEQRANDALPPDPHNLTFGDTAADALLGLAESEGADTLALLHFGRWCPARVLAECEAKRQIVTTVGKLGGHYEPNASRLAPGILRHLAAVYADHPDYREEWRP